MYPAYVDNGGIAFGSGASVDVPFPATVNADDILIMQVLDAAADDFTTPAGWYLLATSSKQAGMSAVWYAIRADGTETGTVTVTSDSADGNGIYGVMSRYSGVIAKGLPIEAIDFQGPDKAATYTVPNCTPTGTYRLMLALPCVENNVTIDPPVDWTEAFEAQSASGDGCSLGVEWLEPPNYVGTASTTGVLGSAENRACMVCALIPADSTNLINEAIATVDVDTDAEAIAAARVIEAIGTIDIDTDAEVVANLKVSEAIADISVSTDAEVLNPEFEEINCISEMQNEIKTMSKMN